MLKAKKIIENLLTTADVRINGDRPWDIRVRNEKLYSRILARGSLGLGESYMDGWWDCYQLDEFFFRILRNELDEKVKWNWPLFWGALASKIFNRQARSQAFTIGEKHYDIGNDLYKAMLDKRLTYTCGYWNSPAGQAKNLDEAQEAKLDLVCRKISLKPGQEVLDIGSGWGSFIGLAAEKYGAKALGITVSKEQKALADKLYKNLPVETRLEDYRDISGKFDHLVSLGMFEHVGYKNYRIFMKVAHKALKDGGLFLLHTIGGNCSAGSMDPWIGKYIFPNSIIPSIKQIGKSIEGLFVMEDWHNFSVDYDKTLMAWYENFEGNWDKIKSNYDEKFYRMWKYYLLSCAGSFRARKNQLWQIVLSKKGVPGGYISVR
jgi:cyclopropane-fatty-acyl-phospholipid synthase